MHSEQVTEFVATDGARFKQQNHCEEYEEELKLVETITLPKTDLKHGTYTQWGRKILLQAKRDLFALVLEKYGDSFPEWREWEPDDVHPMSVVGRVLGDHGGPLANAWSRLACFNFDNGREYDQAYFANHPAEARLASDGTL